MPVSNQSETIDPRILRLIGLDDVFDLDYETYFTLLREALVKANMPGKSIPTEEFEILSNEIKRVKSKKDDGRFEVKKKKITAGSLGLNVGKSTKLLPPVGAIAKSPMGGDLAQSISEIKEVMVSILETLKLQQKADKDAAENERKKAEKEKRGLVESKLEKRFEGIKKAAEKIIAPVKSLFDRLFQFIGTVLLGRIVFKLIEWLGDKNNADKVKSLLRFFGDHWPKLLALYIAFGTSFGKFARGLISLIVKGTAALVRATAGLAAKVLGGKLGGKLGKVAGFLGGGKGKLLVAGVEAAATIGGTLALSKGLENFSGIGEPKAQGLAGGGYVRPRFPAFSGGGFNFKGMFDSGYVSGEKGVDKVPAMLSDGEFVMSVGAVQKYGVDTLEAMNAAGGGTNKPKVMSGTAYAAGGGYIGNRNEAPMYQDTSKMNLDKRLKKIEHQLQLQNLLISGQNINVGNISLGSQYNKISYQGKPSVSLSNNVNVSPMQQWERANPRLAAASAERARIRGTAQSDNPLLDMMKLRSRMSLTPTVQSPNVSNLGIGYQSLIQNVYAGKSPILNQVTNVSNRENQVTNQINNPPLQMIGGPVNNVINSGGFEQKSLQLMNDNRMINLFGMPRKTINPSANIQQSSNAQQSIQNILPNTQDNISYRASANIAKTKPVVKTIRPIPSASTQSKYIPPNITTGNMGGISGANRDSYGPKTPSFSATNPKASNAKAKTLGVRA